MHHTVVEPERVDEPQGAKTPKRAALAGWIGSALEYYDFFIYGTAAALVFPAIFFPTSNPTAGLIASLATFGVGYVARPIGAFFMGHIGDKFGRKRVLILTLMAMGTSTFLVGCLPTYDQVGLLAPGLLVLLRLLQGLSASGEQPGANSMTLEHAPASKRAFYSSFVLSGTQAGSLLANAVFLPLTALLSRDEVVAWGWRVPFWLSLVVVIVGLIIRRTLQETPAFEEEASHGDVPRQPLGVLFREHWSDVIRVVVICLYSVLGTVMGVYGLSFGTNIAKVDAAALLSVATISNVFAIVAIPLFGLLADRIGRKPVFIFGTLGSGVMLFPYFWAIANNSVPLIFVFGIVASGTFGAAIIGTVPALIGEMFATRVRLSGMAIGTQIGYGLSGFAPTVAAAIAGPGPGGWLPVAMFAALACLVSTVAAATARETYKVHMHELGKKAGEIAAAPA